MTDYTIEATADYLMVGADELAEQDFNFELITSSRGDPYNYVMTLLENTTEEFHNRLTNMRLNTVDIPLRAIDEAYDPEGRESY